MSRKWMSRKKNEQKVTFTCASESILKHASKEVGVYLLYMHLLRTKTCIFLSFWGICVKRCTRQHAKSKPTLFMLRYWWANIYIQLEAEVKSIKAVVHSSSFSEQDKSYRSKVFQGLFWWGRTKVPSNHRGQTVIGDRTQFFRSCPLISFSVGSSCVKKCKGQVMSHTDTVTAKNYARSLKDAIQTVISKGLFCI